MSISKTKIPQTLKGFRDFLPEEALKRQWLKDKLIDIFKSWGYQPLETPTLESLALFEGQIGEEEKLFYKFKDSGGRDVALRYDQTVPTCRLVGQYSNQLTFPFKRYQIQSAFRAENTQKGRYREFLQCDADIFGVNSPLADAEVIALSLDIYRQLGFKQAKVLINDRQLLKSIPYQAIVSIDKLGKIGQEGVIRNMVKKGISQTQAKKYLNLIKKIKPNQTINIILDYLKSQGFDKSWYQFDPTIARSFSYSTGPIWEVVIPGFTSGSVLGGERFDTLIEQVSGKSIPGTGFGLGFDRTLEAAEQFNLIPTIKSTTKLLITLFDKATIDQSLKTAFKLRNKQIATEIYPEIDKLSKQFKYANKKNIPFVAIVGPNEIESNRITLKDMETGQQQLLSLEKVIDKLK
jgi:histidyl-tRNA synthetase